MNAITGPMLIRMYDAYEEASNFPVGHVGISYGVQQARLAVVNVTQDRYYRRTKLKVFSRFGRCTLVNTRTLKGARLRHLFGHPRPDAVGGGNQRSDLVVDQLVH